MFKRPPNLIKESVPQLSEELKELGVELSKSLPTYDVPVSLIEPTASNPNEMDDPTFNRLVAEMEATGMIDPIQVVPFEGGKFRIIGGEHRWQGAKVLSWEKIPCNILTDERFVDVDLQELLMVRLNVIKGRINPDKFTKLYEDKVEKYGADQLQTLFGYTSTDAWKKVTKGVEQALTTSGLGSSGLVGELKKRTKQIRSIDGLGRVLNQLFKKYGSDLKHSFMIFTYGGKRHLYIMLSDDAMGALEEIMAKCRKDDRDINDVLVGLFSKELGSENVKKAD